ncbi:MAG TPA: hypothetical protein DEH02_07390 [Bacteroidales bacterium]|nr:MAG: hypothetical protein A2X01_17775 [Bacteroidetes bacterium GWF2_35_48]HBX50875.1 hypothetical protein [Bacteroidales bacterium]
MTQNKNYNWQGKTILIVEDNDINFLLTKEILLKTKVVCIRVKDGPSAINLSQKNININLILMDLAMPGIDGLETTKKIHEIIPNIPILGFSALDNKEEFIEVGACGFIQKPFEVHDFFSIIDEQFQKQN